MGAREKWAIGAGVAVVAGIALVMTTSDRASAPDRQLSTSKAASEASIDVAPVREPAPAPQAPEKVAVAPAEEVSDVPFDESVAPKRRLPASANRSLNPVATPEFDRPDLPGWESWERNN